MNLDERNEHPLVPVLTSRNNALANQAIRLIQDSSRFLEYTLSTFLGGTDHTQRHTRMVEKIARMMLSDDFVAALNSEELFLLTVACHYHDLAMAGTEADDKTAETREQVRRDHAVRIGRIVREKWAELGFESPRWAEVLGEVCRGHRPSKNAEGEANWDELNPTEVLGPGVGVRVRLLSALIYAIDELHLGADRAPERVQKWRDSQDDESRRHWRRHQAISGPVLQLPASLLFQVSADTPAFEENLRSQVFRKALSAVRDLRRQADAEGVRVALPTITIQWQRQRMWELLLSIVCSDMRPRSQPEIVQAILRRFRRDTSNRVVLDGLGTELGNAETELEASAGRCVGDAVKNRHLVAVTDSSGGYVLSASPTHADGFFEQARRADDLDLLFVGRYRPSWEQELFGSEFGRGYVRCTVFPAVEYGYSVRLSQRPTTDPIRLLLELCPTAARMVHEHGPSASNLVKESLLAQIVVAGAMIDFHSDPERLLESSVRAALQALTANNGTVVSTVRLLEELALLGGFTHEQLSAAVCPSEAAQAAIESRTPTGGNPIHIHMTQSVPLGAAGATYLPRLILASQRASTPIHLTATADHVFALRVEGDAELASRDTNGVMVRFGPAGVHPPVSFQLPARVEVTRATRTVRFRLGRFSNNAPTAYPLLVTFPASPPQGQPSEVTFNVTLQLPELTVRDVRALAAANQVVQDSGARIECVLEDGDRQLGVMELPQGSELLGGWAGIAVFQHALRGLDSGIPAPVLLASDVVADIANMTPAERAARWETERGSGSNPSRRVSSAFLRLTTPDGCPFEEQFLRFLPFSFFPPPIFRMDDMAAAEEARRQWTEAEVDCLITCFFHTDIHELARELRNWCQNPRSEFPFRMDSSAPPEPVTRSVMTVRLLRRRDRVWHCDRPIIFEFRPVNRREAYQMEASYWQSVGDERRAQLAQEICERESEVPQTGS